MSVGNPVQGFNSCIFFFNRIISKLHLNLPGSDETGVGFNQVVRDVPARQVQHRVPRGLDSLARWHAARSDRTDGHHGKLLTGAALAGRRRVSLFPLGAL